MKQATLCFLVEGRGKAKRVLLGMKKRGFGKNKWNGFGGKPMNGETIEQTAVRELQEETLLKVKEADLKKMGEIDFVMPAKPEWNLLVHVFVARKWLNAPQETEEMKPQWFFVDALPFEQMWADDKHWLPLLLQKKRFWARFVFENDNETIKKFEIKERKKT